MHFESNFVINYTWIPDVDASKYEKMLKSEKWQSDPKIDFFTAAHRLKARLLHQKSVKGKYVKLGT